MTMRALAPALGLSLLGVFACNGDDHGLGVCGNAVPEADNDEECDRGHGRQGDSE